MKITRIYLPASSKSFFLSIENQIDIEISDADAKRIIKDFEMEETNFCIWTPKTDTAN